MYALALLAWLATAQAPAEAPKTPATLTTQSQTVGDIEIFGVRKLSKEKILQALGVRAGDPLPSSRVALEEALVQIDGVARATVEAVCCEHGGAILYVGIEERGASAFPLRDWPQGEMELPEEIIKAYQDFSVAVAEAARTGDTREEIVEGEAMMDNIACRTIQHRFEGFAEAYTAVLKTVLRDAGDEEQRAVAAYVLGYAPRKQDVTDDLQQALRDPDPGVRANALRALRPIIAWGQSDPELGIRVEPTWFIEMLNSTVIEDRLQGARQLLEMSRNGMSDAMAGHLRERGLTALEEMAHWRRLENAVPAYLLLGRLAGYGDEELEKAWLTDAREEKLREIEKKIRSKK